MLKRVRPAIVVFPASNCQQDMERVLREIYGLDPVIIWHCEEKLPDDITHIILPGGFSFGDYLRAGALASLSPIMHRVKDFASMGGQVLGVCNGFQILCESRLLPGALLRNQQDRFVCAIERMIFSSFRNKNQWSKEISLPIAHRDGRYVADEETLDELKRKQKIILSYCEIDGDGKSKINGSMESIAGIVGGPYDNVIGLMPHPERMAFKDTLGVDGRIVLDEFLFG